VPFNIYIIISVLVVLFCFVLLFFHFFVFPGDTTGTLYLQVTIKSIIKFIHKSVCIYKQEISLNKGMVHSERGADESVSLQSLLDADHYEALGVERGASTRELRNVSASSDV